MGLLSQLFEQCLRLFQIERVESLGEPAVDRREKLASFLPLALIAPETGHAHCGAEFPGLGGGSGASWLASGIGRDAPYC
jgi:hypothetical protein